GATDMAYECPRLQQQLIPWCRESQQDLAEADNACGLCLAGARHRKAWMCRSAILAACGEAVVGPRERACEDFIAHQVRPEHAIQSEKQRQIGRGPIHAGAADLPEPLRQRVDHSRPSSPRAPYEMHPGSDRHT